MQRTEPRGGRSWDRDQGHRAVEGVGVGKTRAGRKLRTNKYGSTVSNGMQPKTLFTPQIKRFLRSWLVRRRKNPYPNRNEKKLLAKKTGLTYMQICNWFANWRRKLKMSSGRNDSSGAEPWGPLIVGYNRQARGHGEQFSISSDDSLWNEEVYSISESCLQTHHSARTTLQSSSKCSSEDVLGPHSRSDDTPAVLLKWLESAAKFRPRALTWGPPVSWAAPRGGPCGFKSLTVHHREEIDAAETLTFLSRQGQRVRL